MLFSAVAASLAVLLARSVPQGRVRYVIAACSLPVCAAWVGYLLLDRTGGPGLLQHSVGMLAMGGGAAAAGRTVRPDATIERARPSASLHAAWLMFLVLTGLTALHFARVGLPIFSPNIDLARWNIRGSGLGGAPGRAYLFGIPLFTVYAVVVANRSSDGDRPSWQLLRNTAIATLFAVRIVGGFRGDLLETVILLALASLLTMRGDFTVPPRIRRFLISGVIISLAAAIAISTQYSATKWSQANEGLSASEQLVRRMTVWVSDAGSLLIELKDDNSPLMRRNSLVNDVDVYLGGSFGLWDASGEYLLNQRLSARLNGRDVERGRQLTAEHYVVPVTTGFAAILYYDFGWLGLLLGSAAVGWTLVRAALQAMAARSSSAAFALVMLVEATRGYIQKADLPYMVINYSLVGVGLLIGLAALTRLTTRVARDLHTTDPRVRGAAVS